MSKLDRLRRAEGITRTDGRAGVENLARLARLLGYKDELHFGQFDTNGAYGDLIEFLMDNPDAIQAVLDFIERNEDLWIPDEDDDERIA